MCGLNATSTPKLGSLVRPGCTFVQVAQETLHEDRCYLDSYSSFHQVFTRKYLSDITRMMTRLKGNCNAGTTYSNLKGLWSYFHMWLVESGITNLLSVPQLEADGFKVDYSNNLLTVIMPEGHVIPFKKVTGKCRGFPYIEMGVDVTSF